MPFLDCSFFFRHVLTTITGLAKVVATETLDLSLLSIHDTPFRFLTTFSPSIMSIDECRKRNQ
jgi:hypothetical protein